MPAAVVAITPPYVLTKPKHYSFIKSVVPDAICIEDLRGLPLQTRCLLAFMTGVIVSRATLETIGAAVNFHPASPSYPGRDPHHWAAYDGAAEYGATAHWMGPKVDEGPILAALIVHVGKGATPDDYRRLGEQSAKALFAEIAPKFSCGELLQWSGVKHSRKDLLSMCDLRGLDAVEVDRRRFAFSGFEQHFKR